MRPQQWPAQPESLLTLCVSICSDVVSQSPPAPSNDSWMGYLTNVVTASANYLPSQVTDTLMQGRAFATVHHNNYGRKNICALALYVFANQHLVQ